MPGSRKGKPNINAVENQAKTMQINIRMAFITKKKLSWIKRYSQVYKGKSHSEIVAGLISDHVAMQQLYGAPHL